MSGTGAAAAHLAAIHAEAFEAPWDTPAFEALLAQAGVLALSEPEGFILIRTVADEAEVLTLAVRPPARRHGLAARLVERARAAAEGRGAERLFLEVAQDNAAARALYARAGFIETGRRPGYYARRDGSQSDALILALTLGQRLP